MHEANAPDWFMLRNPDTGETMSFNNPREKQIIEVVLPGRVAQGVLYVDLIPGYGVRVCLDSAPEFAAQAPGLLPQASTPAPPAPEPSPELPPVLPVPPVPEPSPELPPVPPVPPVLEPSPELPPVSAEAKAGSETKRRSR